MSDEWLLQQVVQKLGGPKAVLDLLPLTLVTSISTKSHIMFFPLDLVALVLSYIQKNDVRNVWLTCKLFAKATTCKHFWHRMINQALDNYMFRTGVRNKELIKFAKSIDMFECVKGQNVPYSDLLAWVFISNSYHEYWIELRIENGMFICQRKTTNHDWKYATMQCKDGFKQLLTRWYEHQKGPMCSFYSEKHRAKFCGKLNRHLHDGQLYKMFDIGPDGKWTFDDGNILEGQGVAFKNEPRFSLQPGEWEHLLKRRKIE